MAEARRARTSRTAPEPVRITNAPGNPRDDLNRRRKRYLLSMSLRSICFVGAVIVGTLMGPGWLLWTLLAGALILPYVAVVVANSASPRIEGTDLVAPQPQYRELER